MSMSKQINSQMKVGCPHFKGEYRKYKQSDYNIYRALNEFIDNVITKSNIIKINLEVRNNKLFKIKICDNYKKGFENIKEEGIENPFNMSHIRSGQYEDSETSQFGIGMKAGAISTGEKFEVYTRVANTYYKVEMDFIEMSERDNPMESFNPKLFEISKDEYLDKHKDEYGSTIVLSCINDNIYHRTNEEDIINDILNNLSETYGNIIKQGRVSIIVNDIEVQYKNSYFESPECSIFNKDMNIYMLEKEGYETLYYAEIDGKLKVINKSNSNKKKWTIKMIDKSKEKSLQIIQEEYLNKGYKYKHSFSSINKECIRATSTFTLYHPNFYTKEGTTKKITRDRIQIYRGGRLYGNWGIEEGANGSKNFNDNKVILKSKELISKLGLTFNKHISRGNTNDLCDALHIFMKNLRQEFNADTGTSSNEKLYIKALENGIYVSDGSNNTENRIHKKYRVGVPEPALEPAPEPSLEPKPEPALEPTLEPKPEPKPEPALEPAPAPEPALEPAPAPAPEPAPEPVSDTDSEDDSDIEPEEEHEIQMKHSHLIRIMLETIKSFKNYTVEDFNIEEADNNIADNIIFDSLIELNNMLRIYTL